MRLVIAAWLLRLIVALAAPKWRYKHDFVHLTSEAEPQLERRQDDTSFRQLREDYRQTVMQQLEDQGDDRCNSDNVVVREEWYVEVYFAAFKDRTLTSNPGAT